MDEYAKHNDFILCPYNKAHKVAVGTRFQRHLIECRKNNPDAEDVICPFNYTHRVKGPELSYHIDFYCPEAKLATRQLVTVVDDTKYEPPVLGLSVNGPVATPNKVPAKPDEDNWDDDMPSEPKAKTIGADGWKSGLTFINTDRLSGLKPAQKKKIRQQLSRGDELDIIKSDNTEELVTTSNLKNVRIPTEKPYVEQFSQMQQIRQDAIAVMNSTGPPIIPFGPLRNKADGIFDQTSYPTMPPVVPSAKLPSMGRGVACMRPPPGLEQPKLKSMGRGVAIFPAHNSCKSEKAPPGFGSLSDTNDNDEKFDNMSQILSEMSLESNGKSFYDEVTAKVDEQAEREKKKRRIEKKLREIEHLKNKQTNGETLNAEELAKVKSEERRREELRLLKEH